MAALSLDDDDAADWALNLKSAEGDVYQVSKRTCMMSELIKTISEGDVDAKEIPLLNVKSSVLRKVIEYMRHHADNPPKEIEKPLRSSNMAEVASQWDADFVGSDQMLFELILAANYLDIKPLLDLACAKVASMIHGKNPEQIRNDMAALMGDA